MESLASLLAEHPFFSGLDSETLNLLVGCASNVRFDEGQTILTEGDDANVFYIIRSGNVAVDVAAPGRGPITISTLGEGDILGWSWLVPPFKWNFDARAIEQTRAIALDGQCLRGKMDENCKLGYEILSRFSRIMVQRLKATRMQLLDVYGRP